MSARRLRGVPARRLRLGVLASGNGSNLQAILDACAAGRLDADVAVVVSDKRDARALERARFAGVKAVHLDAGGMEREAHERLVAAELDAAGCEVVCLAGYMRLLTPWFVRKYHGRLLNIHPSLLPAFRGMHAARQAIEAGVKVAGVTVHFVDEEVDAGPILLQAAIPIDEGDTEDSLVERIHAVEHRIYPAAIQLLAEGRVRLEGRRVRIDGGNTITGTVGPEGR